MIHHHNNQSLGCFPLQLPLSDFIIVDRENHNVTLTFTHSCADERGWRKINIWSSLIDFLHLAFGTADAVLPHLLFFLLALLCSVCSVA